MALASLSPASKLKAASVGDFVTFCKVAPVGALQARKLSNGGVLLYWRFTHEGKTHRVAVGPLDLQLPPKSLKPIDGAYSIMAATRAAELLAQRHIEARDRGGHQALAAAERAERVMLKSARDDAATYTFRRLLECYCAHQERLGRTSHRDACNLFENHIFRPWPAVAALPAMEVTDEQIADIGRVLIEAGKRRTANKLRAYLHSAFQKARSSRTDSELPLEFKRFGIRQNPVSATAANTGNNLADKDPLKQGELQAYWKAIQGAEGFKAAVLRLHLLTGGQRLAQLARLRATDVADDLIVLYDGKGRPGKAPRAHAVPLLPGAREALEMIGPTGTWAISTDQGKTPISPETISGWAAEAGRSAGIAEFKAKRIRSGIETLLAHAQVSKEARGWLQSHGLSGVQNNNYVDHTMDEFLTIKLRALETLLARLEAVAVDNVRPIRLA